MKVFETTTKYWDALLQLGPSATPAAPKLSHLVLMAPRLQARELVRARQVLIDMAADKGLGSVTLSREPIASLRDQQNRALADCDPVSSNFKARVVTHLKNGGILMELGSNEAI